MKTKFASTTLLAAVTALGLGTAPAFAAAPSVNSGYKFSDFWGDVPAQHTTTPRRLGSRVWSSVIA